MNIRINKYLPEKNWYIEEKDWDKDRQAVSESLFCLGNGLLGSRGILEEVPYGCRAGTYLSGLYDARGSKVPELVNLPNPINLRITTEEEKIDVVAMDVLQHKRYLNLHQGLLLRHTIFQDAKGRKFDYQSIRFLSMDKKNIAAMQVFLTPLSGGCCITAQTSIDTAVSNIGTITEGRKKHFRITRILAQTAVEFMCVRTSENKIPVSYSTALKVSLGGKSWYCEEHPLQLKLKKKQTVCFTKICYMGIGYNHTPENIEKTAVRNLKENLKAGFDGLLKRHTNKWEKVWKNADIVIKGDDEIQRNIRFNIYHLLIAAPEDAGKSSIGARTLSGEGYRGHIFWDAEVFILPFFVYTRPQIAKNMLLYRYRRLEEARQLAKKHNYRGAMFPWESADTGREVTPAWAKDLDGAVIRIHTHKMEHHITADIAYAVYQYYLITGDEDFMLDYGFEMLFETARFWADRLKYNKESKKFEIRNVIGPDEFHVDIPNNAYTNFLARWNLFTACAMYVKMRKKHPRDAKRIIHELNLQDKEVRKWKKIISRIYFTFGKNNLIEQFQGFFKKKDIRIRELDENFMPVLPKTVSLRRVGETQLVKQADVLLLLYLFSDAFDFKTKKKNYAYYAPRTVHKSSLSAPIHAIMAQDTGNTLKAYRYFYVSLNADLRNFHRNTHEGIHAASLGATWQAAVCGFAGMRILKGTLSFNPRLPAHWKNMSFTIQWRAFTLKLTITHKDITLRSKSKNRERKLKLKIFGKVQNITPNKTFVWSKGERRRGICRPSKK